VAQENCHFCGVLNPGACTRAEANRQLPLGGKARTNACGVGSRHPASLQLNLVCVCVFSIDYLHGIARSQRNCTQKDKRMIGLLLHAARCGLKKLP